MSQSAATGSNDGIIAIVDRGGRLLGVFVESGVSANILHNPELLTFAIDGEDHDGFACVTYRRA